APDDDRRFRGPTTDQSPRAQVRDTGMRDGCLLRELGSKTDLRTTGTSRVDEFQNGELSTASRSQRMKGDFWVLGHKIGTSGTVKTEGPFTSFGAAQFWSEQKAKTHSTYWFRVVTDEDRGLADVRRGE